MKTWRIADGPALLIDLGRSLQSIPQELNCMLFPHDYCVVDGDHVVERFETRVWSDDEQLGATYHEVSGAELRKHFETWRREETVILTGLTEVTKTNDQAREALSLRVRSYGMSLDKELLQTLDHLSAAPGAAAEAACSLFAEGCRSACFARLETEDHTVLIARLEEVETMLRDTAEGQFNCDALLNAAAYRKAADRVALARDVLKHGQPA